MPKPPSSNRPPSDGEPAPDQIGETAANTPSSGESASSPASSSPGSPTALALDARFSKQAVGGFVGANVVRATGGVLTRFPARHKRSISVVTDKGGVGKSTLITQLVQWFLDIHREVRIRAYDPDNANRTLLAFQSAVTEFVDVTQPSSLDAPVLDLMSKYDAILFDGLGSQQTKTFIGWTEQVNFYDIAEANGIAPTFILIVEEDADVAEQAYRVLMRVGPKVDWLIVRTHKSSEHMGLWDHSAAREYALGELGATEIFFPKITEHLVRYLQELRLPISIAGSPRQGLNEFDRQRLITLTRDIYEQFDGVASLLLPPVRRDVLPA